MNIRSPTSNPVLQTIELSINSRTWPLVQWVLLESWESLLKRGSLPAVRPQCSLGSRFVDSVDAWVVDPCPNSDVELWSIPCQLNWLILNVLLRMVWPVASLTVAIELQQFMITLYVLFFRLCPFFSWINLFQQLLVYLVCFFSPPFFEVPWYLNQTPWSRTSRMPPKCRLRIFHSCPCSTQWTPGRERKETWEWRTAPLKAVIFFEIQLLVFRVCKDLVRCLKMKDLPFFKGAHE